MHLEKQKKSCIIFLFNGLFLLFWNIILFLVILKVYFVSIIKPVPAFFCLVSAYCIYFHSFYFWSFCVLIFRVCLLSASYCACMLSHVRIFATPSTIIHQVPTSVGFSRQEYWSALPFPSAGDLLTPGTEPKSPVAPALAHRFFTTEPPGKRKHHTAGSHLFVWSSVQQSVL